MKKVLAMALCTVLLAMTIPMGIVGVSAEAPANGGWTWPLTGAIFVRGYDNGHYGIDISAASGTAVKAVNSGVVTCASTATSAKEGYCGTCGRYGAGYHVTVRHADGTASLYAHLSAVSVAVSQSVAGGQQIGQVGSTGNSTGPHLHLSMFANQQYSDKLYDANLVDPLHYITPFSDVYVTDVTETSATIHGTFGAFGPTVVQAGIYIGTDPAHMTKITETLNTEGYMANGAPLQGLFYGTGKWYGTLKAGTTYYYRMWITRFGKEYVTAVRSFTTLGGHTHSYGEWSVTTEATCNADGQQMRTCACGASETQTIPATGEHAYDDEYDADCNTCGGVRQVEERPVADAPAFVVENVSAREGEEFTVAIRTLNNSGIVSLKLKMGYDADLLELVAVEEQDFVNMTYSPLTANPFIINWVDAIHPNNTTDGVVALVTFRVKEGAEVSTTDITLSYDPEDVYDQNYENVTFRVERGFVSIVEYTAGDVNGDGRINNKDLGLLQQYVNEWNVTVAEAASDVNGDGRVNNKDLGLLQQYVNEWDVELG